MGTVPYASSGGTHRLYLVSIIKLYKAFRWWLVARACRHQGAELSLARPAEELIRHKTD
jgi:hypothetical protein